jgi:chemotaxis protein CheZ
MNAKAHPAADDLEALFDSIAAQPPVAAPVNAAAPAPVPAAPADVDDLEALFDQVAAERAAAAPAPVRPQPARPVASSPTPAPATATAGDSDELEALFDSVAAQRAQRPPAATTAPAVAEGEDPAEHLFHRVGQLTRTLHDALRELGYDKKIATAASSLPDARDRLAYIATLTGQAADKVLGAVELAQGEQQQIDASARALEARWGRLYANELGVDEFKALAGETRAYLAALPTRTATTQQHLHEIMMAQDFHDLTGQVIKKVVELAGTLETNLVALLVESQQLEKKPDAGWLTGPAMSTAGTEVVRNQVEVDSLLESLGF